MFEIFKTNVENAKQAETLVTLLHHYFPFAEINFDLDDCDNILRVKGEKFCLACITQTLAKKGFECQVLD